MISCYKEKIYLYGLYELSFIHTYFVEVKAVEIRGVPLSEAIRDPADTDSKKIFLLDGILLPKGKVTEFQASINSVAGKAAQFRFQIYRAANSRNEEYYLVGEKVVPAPTSNFLGIKKVID